MIEEDLRLCGFGARELIELRRVLYTIGYEDRLLDFCADLMAKGIPPGWQTEIDYLEERLRKLREKANAR